MGLLDGLFDKEKMVADTITGCLQDLVEELNCSHTELFIMIKPTDEEMNFKCWVYRIVEGKPKIEREITLKEILGG
ncbi:MAG: hypothetical protein ACOVJ8_01505 [Sediminibacterium sp.]